MVIGIIAKPGLAWDFLLMETPLIDTHRVRKGGFYEVEVARTKKGYVSGKDLWPQITTFKNRL